MKLVEIMTNNSFVMGWIIALIIAFLARLMVRKKCTIELIMKIHTDEDFIKNADQCSEMMREKNIDLNKANKNINEYLLSPEAQPLLYILNFWEFAAVGINNKIYDEQILVDAHYSSVVNLGRATRSLIENMQDKQSTSYKEFTALYKKWNGLKVLHKYSPARVFLTRP